MSLSKDNVLHSKWCCGLVESSYRIDGFRKAPTTDLCSIVNQLDTARRFIWNEVTKAKCPVDNSIKINLSGYLNDLRKEFNNEIAEIESAIQSIMDKIDSPITTIPGISLRMGAMIIAEVGDFNNFDSPDKILAFAGLSPSTYQSGQLNNCYAHMEKRGSRYLRYALFNAAKLVCYWNPLFADYLAKKRSEGKLYNVAISHAAKKLVRLIFALQKSGQPYIANFCFLQLFEIRRL